ncbi:MAG: 4Fe-4S binding protein, partial [Solobacterium sp.]|nr:4Fe-4S binding protein [Solobacterium sp.]
LAENELPSACIQCGQCTHACPQGINVPKALAELSDMYVNGPHWADAAKPRHEDIRKALHMD